MSSTLTLDMSFCELAQAAVVTRLASDGDDDTELIVRGSRHPACTDCCGNVAGCGPLAPGSGAFPTAAPARACDLEAAVWQVEFGDDGGGGGNGADSSGGEAGAGDGGAGGMAAAAALQVPGMVVPPDFAAGGCSEPPGTLGGGGGMLGLAVLGL